MSFWSRLLGTDDSVSKVIDHTASGIDKIWYSAQERTQDEIAANHRATDMLLDWIKSTSGQNVTRRVLAFSIAGAWLFMVIAATIGDMVSVWVDPEFAKLVIETSKALDRRAEQLADKADIILLFYFAAPHIGSGVRQLYGSYKERKERRE